MSRYKEAIKNSHPYDGKSPQYCCEENLPNMVGPDEGLCGLQSFYANRPILRFEGNSTPMLVRQEGDDTRDEFVMMGIKIGY